MHDERTRVRPLTVVVADHRPDARRAVCRALGASAGFAVLGEAADAFGAVELAARAEADVAVFGLGIGPRGGFAALEALRAARASCGAFVVSDLERAAAVDEPGRFERDLEDLLVVPTGIDAAIGEGHDSYAVELAASTATVATARAFVADALVLAGRADHVDIATLLASELVTNAVVHARSPAGLVVRAIGDAVRVEVRDAGEGMLALRDVSPMALGGRGLHIVDALADVWGACSTQRAKVVWFDLADA